MQRSLLKISVQARSLSLSLGSLLAEISDMRSISVQASPDKGLLSEISAKRPPRERETFLYRNV